MTFWLILPLLIPLVSATTSILVLPWPRLQRLLGIGGTAGLFFSGLGLLWTVCREGIQVGQVGGWTAPFGISLVADIFSAIMVVIAGLIGLAVSFYSIAGMDSNRQSFGYYPLLNFMLLGVCGAFLTGDIFNLYVWFEVMLMSSFVLLVLGGERAQMEGAIKYVTLNLMSSALFLAAVGILYGLVGSLNMADVALKIGAVDQSELVFTLAALFFVAFGIKAAVFPLFFWLPASYHTPPAVVSAVFAGLLTKVGVYALIRVFTLIFAQHGALIHQMILVIAALTMITGVLGAVAQNEFRRVLSFHIVSQIGYMLMGLGLFTPLALAGSVFYIVHHIIVKTNLFLVSGIVHKTYGTGELKELGGLYQISPVLSVLFMIPALSLAGVPPLSGFFAKLILVQAGLNMGQYLIVGMALLVSLLTLFSMTKIWEQVFWKQAGPSVVDSNRIEEPVGFRKALLVPVLCLALITVGFGLCAEPLLLLARQAAEQLFNPVQYIEAVLKGQ